jgi:acyl-CoA thioesterase-1
MTARLQPYDAANGCDRRGGAWRRKRRRTEIDVKPGVSRYHIRAAERPIGDTREECLAAKWLIRVSRPRVVVALLLAGGVLTCAPDGASAVSVTIVALGTSNTYGYGVARNQTYPAQLQAMLRAKGIDTVVINAGVNGDSSAGMLTRLNSAVPNGTRLVIVETYSGNERRNHVAGQTSQNLAAIRSRLKACGIDTIDISRTMTSAVRAAGSGSESKLRHGHLTAAGYATVVPSLASEVAAALGR